jgi:hypothetical protein
LATGVRLQTKLVAHEILVGDHSAQGDRRVRAQLWRAQRANFAHRRNGGASARDPASRPGRNAAIIQWRALDIGATIEASRGIVFKKIPVRIVTID